MCRKVSVKRIRSSMLPFFFFKCLFHVGMETFSCQEELMEMDVHLACLCFPKLSSFVSGEMGVSAESSRSASQ